MPSIGSLAISVAIVAVIAAAAATGSHPASQQEAIERGGALTFGIQPSIGERR